MNAQEAAARQATIDRAVRLLDTAHPHDLAVWLAKTNLHDHVKADPAQLRRDLAAADPDNWAGYFGTWKAAQQLLQAAGLPH